MDELTSTLSSIDLNSHKPFFSGGQLNQTQNTTLSSQRGLLVALFPNEHRVSQVNSTNSSFSGVNASAKYESGQCPTRTASWPMQTNIPRQPEPRVSLQHSAHSMNALSSSNESYASANAALQKSFIASSSVSSSTNLPLTLNIPVANQRFNSTSRAAYVVPTSSSGLLCAAAAHGKPGVPNSSEVPSSTPFSHATFPKQQQAAPHYLNKYGIGVQQSVGGHLDSSNGGCVCHLKLDRVQLGGTGSGSAFRPSCDGESEELELQPLQSYARANAALGVGARGDTRVVPVTMQRHPARVSKPIVCVFCRKNGEDESLYTTHTLKDGSGNVQCPMLRRLTCPLCHETGDKVCTLTFDSAML